MFQYTHPEMSSWPTLSFPSSYFFSQSLLLLSLSFFLQSLLSFLPCMFILAVLVAACARRVLLCGHPPCADKKGVRQKVRAFVKASAEPWPQGDAKHNLRYLT
jgi:hypothetical protein